MDTILDDALVFRAVAEELSFTQAAHRLHLSVPTVSQRVRRLERRLERRLLHRSTARVEVTAAGTHLLAWVVQAEAALAELRRVLDDPTPSSAPRDPAPGVGDGRKTRRASVDASMPGGGRTGPLADASGPPP